MSSSPNRHLSHRSPPTTLFDSPELDLDPDSEGIVMSEREPSPICSDRNIFRTPTPEPTPSSSSTNIRHSPSLPNLRKQSVTLARSRGIGSAKRDILSIPSSGLGSIAERSAPPTAPPTAPRLAKRPSQPSLPTDPPTPVSPVKRARAVGNNSNGGKVVRRVQSASAIPPSAPLLSEDRPPERPRAQPNTPRTPVSPTKQLYLNLDAFRARSPPPEIVSSTTRASPDAAQRASSYGFAASNTDPAESATDTGAVAMSPDSMAILMEEESDSAVSPPAVDDDAWVQELNPDSFSARSVRETERRDAERARLGLPDDFDFY